MHLDRAGLTAHFNKPPKVATFDFKVIEGQFSLRMMNGAEREQYERAGKDDLDKSRPTARSRAFVRSVCDPHGKLLFSEADIAQINTMDWRILDEVYDAFLDFNGLTKKAHEDAEKNSGEVTLLASSSTSANGSACSSPTLLSESLPPS